MNNTDRASIFIVSLFYVVTLASGYIIHSNHLIGNKNQVERLVLTINSSKVNSNENSIVVYEDRGASQPTKKVYEAGSVVSVSSIYEQKGYKLDHITEFLEKVMGQEVIVTRIWFSKSN